MEKNQIFTFTVWSFSLRSFNFYMFHINKNAIKLGNKRYIIHVLDLRRHILVLNIVRRHQNGPYLMLSILHVTNINHKVHTNWMDSLVLLTAIHHTS